MPQPWQEAVFRALGDCEVQRRMSVMYKHFRHSLRKVDVCAGPPLRQEVRLLQRDFKPLDTLVGLREAEGAGQTAMKHAGNRI